MAWLAEAKSAIEAPIAVSTCGATAYDGAWCLTRREANANYPGIPPAFSVSILYVLRTVLPLIAIRHKHPGGRVDGSSGPRNGRAFLEVRNCGDKVDTCETERRFQMNPSGSIRTPVRIGPGETVTARTFRPSNCSAMTLVSALSAAFATL
ncbi:hypothetical protein ABH935_009922 [Catenulispora sp. GAS73]